MVFSARNVISSVWQSSFANSNIPLRKLQSSELFFNPCFMILALQLSPAAATNYQEISLPVFILLKLPLQFSPWQDGEGHHCTC